MVPSVFVGQLEELAAVTIGALFAVLTSQSDKVLDKVDPLTVHLVAVVSHATALPLMHQNPPLRMHNPQLGIAVTVTEKTVEAVKADP